MADTSPQSPTINNTWSRHALAIFGFGCCTLVAIAVRLWRLEDVNFWFDESFTIRMSEFSTSEILRRSALDTHPPLYFIILKCWNSAFGVSHWWSRMLSVLWSVAAVCAAYGFVLEYSSNCVNRLCNTSRVIAATLSGLYLALSPLQVDWAQQVRMYAAVSCLAILSTWLLWRVLVHPAAKTRWVAFCIIEIVAVHTHVTLFFLFAAHICALAFGLLLRQKRGSAVKGEVVSALFCVLAIIVISMPLIIVIKSQHARVVNDFWVLPFTWDMLSEALAKCFTIDRDPVKFPKAGIWIMQGIILLSVLISLNRNSCGYVVGISTLFSFLIIIGLSVVDTNIVHPRYFMIGHSLVGVLFGIVALHARALTLQLLISSAVLYPLAIYQLEYRDWRRGASDNPGLPQLLRTWKEHRDESDPLVHCIPMFYITSRVYAGDNELMFVYGSESRHPFYTGTALLDEDEYIDDEAINAGPWNTVWGCEFILTNRWMRPLEMPAGWRLIDETSMQEFNGTFYLRRYERVVQ